MNRLPVSRAFAARAVFALLLFAVPLALNMELSDQFHLTKMIIIQVLGAGLLMLCAGGLRLKDFYHPRFLAALTFFAVNVLSFYFFTFFSRDHSMYIKFVYSFLLFFCAHLMSPGKKHMPFIMDAACLAGLAVAVFGILLHHRVYVIWSTETPSISTLGNPNFVAQYLIFIIPLSLVLLVFTGGAAKKAFYAAVLSASCYEVFITRTRAAWVGLFFSALFIAFVFYRLSRAGGGSFSLIKKAALGAVCLLALLFAGNAFMPHSRTNLIDDAGYRFLSLFEKPKDSSLFRILAWKSTMDCIRERPVMGWGVGNLQYVYPAYRTIRENVISGGAQVRRAHNEYVQFGAELGLVGLTVFLWFLAVTFRYIFHYIWRLGEENGLAVYFGISAGLVTTAAHIFFDFNLRNAAPLVYFWTFAGFLSLYEKKKDAGGPGRAVGGPLLWLAAAALFLIALTSVKLYYADFLEAEAKKSYARNDYREALSGFKKLDLFMPGTPLYKHSVSEAYQKLNDYENALLWEEKALAEFRYFDRAVFNQASIFEKKGERIKAIYAYKKLLSVYPLTEKARNNIGINYKNMGLYKNSIKEYTLALTMNPKFDEGYINLSNLYRDTGDFKKAETVLKKGSYSDPSSEIIRHYLGILYMTKGDDNRAVEEFNKAIELNGRFTDSYINAGYLLKKTGRFAEAEELYKSALAFAGDNMQIYKNLGALYFETGRVAETVSLWEEALAKNPGASDIRDALSIARGRLSR